MTFTRDGVTYLTSNETATRLNITEAALRVMAHRNTAPPSTKFAHRRLYPATELEHWINAQIVYPKP